AIADLYDSAFGHSGQKCSAASLVIFVGAAGKSDRLRNQLLDAVRTLKVGPGFEVETTMNGLVEPPSDKLLRGLTQLDPGEKWLISQKSSMRKAPCGPRVFAITYSLVPGTTSTSASAQSWASCTPRPWKMPSNGKTPRATA